MKKITLLASLVLLSGLAQAQESPYDWGRWAVDAEQPPISGYDVEEYDQGVEAQVPMTSDLENSITPVGPVESALSDFGGTINDIIEEVQLQNPGATLNDIVTNLPANVGDAGSDVGDIVNDVLDAI